MLTAAEKIQNWQSLSAAVYRAFPWKRGLLAISLTLFIHGAVYNVAPETLTMLSRTVVPANPVELSPVEEIEKIPENLLPEEFRRKPQFVPVNPNAPSATPKDDANFSAADQRAAQENPDANSRDRTPTNEGELETSRAIAEQVLPRELLPPELRQFVPSTREKQPSDSVKETEGKTPNEGGVNVEARPEGRLAKGADAVEDGKSDGDTETVPDPSPRPRIVPPPGLKSITMRSNTAVSEIGTCSLDAKYSEFGDYTQRMLEAIQAAWYIAIWRSTIMQSPAVVIIEFTLHSDGTLDNVRVVYSTASTPATYACLDAVESRAPFEPWRADMVALVGKESETSRLSFYYR